MIYSKIAGFVFVTAVLLPVSFLSAAELCVELSYTIKVNQDTKISSIKCIISSMNSQNNFNLDYLMRKLADAAVAPTPPESPASGSGSVAPVPAPPSSPVPSDPVVEAPSAEPSKPKKDPSVVPAVKPLDSPAVKPPTSPTTGVPAPVGDVTPAESTTAKAPIYPGPTPLEAGDPRIAEFEALEAADAAKYPGPTPLEAGDPRIAEFEALEAWQNPRGFKGSQNDLWNLYTGTTDRTQVNRDALVAVGKQVDPSFDMSPGQYHDFMASWYKMDPNIPLGSALAAFKAAPPANTDTTVNNNNKGFDFNNVNWPLWIGGGSLALLALMILLERRRKRRDDDE